MAKINRQEIGRQRVEGRKYNCSHFVHGNPSPREVTGLTYSKGQCPGLKNSPMFPVGEYAALTTKLPFLSTHLPPHESRACREIPHCFLKCSGVPYLSLALHQNPPQRLLLCGSQAIYRACPSSALIPCLDHWFIWIMDIASMWYNLGTWPDGYINYEYFFLRNSSVGHGKQTYLNGDGLFGGREVCGGFSEDLYIGIL